MPIADYNEILERPVFSPTRRPAEESAPAESEQFFQSPASQLADGEFKLIGIIIVDESRFALLQTAGTGQTQRVQIGETVDGWRISALSPSTATIERGSEAKTLELERKSDPQLAARAQANKRREKLAARNAKKKIAATAPADTPVTSNSANEPQLPNDGDDE